MGFDYGRGLTNIDRKTSIRYGIIPAHLVGDAWYSDSEPFYPPYPICPNCGYEYRTKREPVKCPKCKNENFDMMFDDAEVPFIYRSDRYVLEQPAGDPDIWVFKSPFYTIAGYCSPCAPGAVYLTDTSPDARGYCLGHNWFEGGRAPYKVFSVKTGKEIIP